LLCLLLQKIHFLVAVMALKKTRILISKVNIKFYRCTMEWDQPTGHQHHTSDWNVLIVGNWVDYATEISAAINQEYTTVFNFFWLVAIRPWNSIQLDVCKTMKRKIVNFWMSYIHSLVGRLPTDQRQDICSSSNQQVVDLLDNCKLPGYPRSKMKRWPIRQSRQPLLEQHMGFL
jgi:hypothetical protein